MAKTMTWALLVLCSCASSSRWFARRDEPLAGSWRGVLVSGGMRTAAEVRLAGREGSYTGSLWGPALASLALSNVQLGSPALASAVPMSNVQLGGSVRFEVPERRAQFEGTIRDEIIEGTFRDEHGGGFFRLEKQPDMTDDVRYTP